MKGWLNTLTVRGQFRQYWAALTVNMGIMTGGAFFGWPSPTLPKLQQADAPFHMDHTDITWMVSLLYLGNVISPLPTGYLMDRFGCKRSLIYCSVFPISSWILIFFATSPLHLHIARLLAGLWVGIITTTAPMYTGEITQPKICGALGNLFAMMTYLGTLFVYAIGPYVSYHALAMLAGIIPVYFLVMLTLIPESPYYFLTHKDKDGARESLRWLRGEIDEYQLELEVNAMEETVKKQIVNKGSIKDIFKTHANRKAFLIVQLYAIFVKFSGIGLIMAFSSITLPKTAFQSLSPSECAIILALIWVVSSIFSIILVDRFGRKTLLAGSSLGCCVTMFIAGLWFFLDAKTTLDVEGISWIPFTCFVVHGFLNSMGIGPVGISIKGELLSADIRASASAIITVVFALASLFLSQIYLPVADHIGMYANYWLYSANCLICTVFTVCMFVETKGKTLQEIQDKLSKKKSLTFKVSVNVPTA